MLVATAGHIDHGKTALIRALTGVETDRLPEEKKRGISIDLGFAYWQQADGGSIGFVDVPGHERFVRNMVAGICGVNLALIVVAADDGVMPQTIEHVQILDLLGVASALVAITKCDRVGADRIAQARLDVEALLAGTRFAGAPQSNVSSVSGDGIGQLSDALKSAYAGASERLIEGRGFRLAIDRVFAVTGVGTVVSGTVLAGEAHVGDRLILSPSGKPVRVRSIQNAGRDVLEARAGERCALNLAGIDRSEARRGDSVMVPDMHATTSRMDVLVRVIDAPLKHNSKVHLHLRTADLVGRVLIPGQGSIGTGAEGIAQILLDESSDAVVGDPFIVRDASGQRLIGGGQVIDPFAPSGRRGRGNRVAVTSAFRLLDPRKVLEALSTVPGHEVDVEKFRQRFNLTDAAASALFAGAEMVLIGRAGRIALPRSRVDIIAAQVIDVLAALHSDRPDLPGLAVRELAAPLSEAVSVVALEAILKDMAERHLVSFVVSLVRLPGHAPSFSPADIRLWNDLLNWREQAEPLPFTLDEAIRETGGKDAALKTVLYRRCATGDLFQMDERRYLMRAHVGELARVAADLGAEFSAAQFRDASGIGRNMVIRILEFLDATGITTRNGDLRRMAEGYETIAGL